MSLWLFVHVDIGFFMESKITGSKNNLVGLVVAGFVAQFISAETTAEVQKSGAGVRAACGGISTVLAVVLAVSLAVVIRKVATASAKSYLALGYLWL